MDQLVLFQHVNECFQELNLKTSNLLLQLSSEVDHFENLLL